MDLKHTTMAKRLFVVNGRIHDGGASPHTRNLGVNLTVTLIRILTLIQNLAQNLTVTLALALTQIPTRPLTLTSTLTLTQAVLLQCAQAVFCKQS